MLIIIIISFAILAGIMFILNQNSTLNNERDRNLELIEKNENLKEENDKVKTELNYFNKSIENMYEILETTPNIDKRILKQFKEKEDIGIKPFQELLQRLNEELERKKRYDFLKFTVLEVNIDYLEKHKELYGDKVEEIYIKLKNRIVDSIRMIDFMSYGKEYNKFYLLLPMTEINGSIVLAQRIQTMMEDMSAELSLSLTISICEVSDIDSADDVMTKLHELCKDGLESGGNIIKIAKC